MERGIVKGVSQGIPRETRVRARIEAQNAAQWLARLAHSYTDVPADEIELYWDVASRRIVTPQIAPGITVQLSLAPLTLQFEESGRPVPHPIEVDGKSSTEVEAWALVELLHRGFDREKFSKRLPYDPPHLMSGDETKYSSEELLGDLQGLQQCFEDAAEVLQETKAALVSEAGATLDANMSSHLTLSPERFDLAVVFPTFGDDPKGGLTKVGFTAGDDKNPDPRYFVVRATSAQGAHRKNGDVALAPVALNSTNRADLVARLIQQAKVVRDTAAN